jgi:hypothetical protein
MTRKLASLILVAAACKSPDGAADAASASASASASVAQAAPDVPVTRGKWWTVAQKSRVYTEERRVDADNALRMLAPPQRDTAVRALNDMAKQNADGDGLRAAAQIARDAQDRVDDVRNPAPKNAIATGGFIVLHGMVATACADHPDVASLTPVIAAIREMPLPRLEKSDGRPERNVLEQEMRTALDDKTMKALLAGAPGAKKNPP